MNRYRFVLVVGVFLFLLLSFVSAFTGAGYGQSFLIIICFLLVSGILGTGIYQWGAKAFWWEYFKPTAAVPIAWGLLHLGIALLLPVPARMAWEMDKGVILGFELGILVLTYILNLFVPFEQLKTRRLLNFVYSVCVLIAGGMILVGLFGGDWREKINAKSFALISQTAAERRTAAIKNIPIEAEAEALNQRLKELQEEIQNPKQRPTDQIIKEAEGIKKQITDLTPQISPPEQKIYPAWLPALWEKIKPIPDMPRRSLVWIFVLILAGAGIVSTLTGYKSISGAVWGLAILFIVALSVDWLVWGGGWTEIQNWRTPKKDSRPAGIYKLPADGRVISTTIDGRELDLKTGDRFQLTQLGQAGRYVFVNHDIPSHEIHERSITMRTVSDGKIELMSTETDKSMTIQAKVFR